MYFLYCLVLPSVYLRLPRGIILLFVQNNNEEKDTANDNDPAGSLVLLSGTERGTARLRILSR